MRAPLIALLWAMVPAQAMAQQETLIPYGAMNIALRACIDYAGYGALHATGKAVPDESRDPSAEPSYFHLFRERGELFGRSDWRIAEVGRSDPLADPVNTEEAVIFLAIRNNRRDFISWSWVWRDVQGRRFIPISAWPKPGLRDFDWAPLAIRMFARPVTYRQPQPYWHRYIYALGKPNEDPDLYVARGGKLYVRYGLYLSDIPALFAAAKSEPCWRWQ
ncbi:MAG: hypothetical protein ACAH11_04660 [Sphingomonas sp.]